MLRNSKILFQKFIPKKTKHTLHYQLGYHSLNQTLPYWNKKNRIGAVDHSAWFVLQAERSCFDLSHCLQVIHLKNGYGKHLSIILLFSQQTEPPRSLSRSRNFQLFPTVIIIKISLKYLYI